MNDVIKRERTEEKILRLIDEHPDQLVDIYNRMLSLYCETWGISFVEKEITIAKGDLREARIKSLARSLKMLWDHGQQQAQNFINLSEGPNLFVSNKPVNITDFVTYLKGCHFLAAMRIQLTKKSNF